MDTSHNKYTLIFEYKGPTLNEIQELMLALSKLQQETTKSGFDIETTEPRGDLKAQGE